MRKLQFVTSFLGMLSATCAFATANAAAAPDVKDLGHALHFSICESSIDAVLAKLGLHAPAVDVHQVSYFDSAVKESLNCGLTVRVSDVSKVLKSNVNLKLNDLSAVDPALFTNSDFRCEFDQYAATSTLDCSLDASVQATELITNDQLKFITSASKCNPVIGSTLQYGPVSESKWTGLAFVLNGRALSLDAERITFSSGEQLLELTTRTSNIDAPSTDAELLTDLKARGISLCPLQQSPASYILENLSPHPRAF